MLEAQPEAIGFNRIITDGKVAKISVLIDEDETKLAAQVLHSAYELDAVD